jgi:hypothetical protein
LHARLEWRAVLAVYTGGFALTVAFSLLTSLTQLPILGQRLVFYSLLFGLYLIVGRRMTPSDPRLALAAAAVATIVAWAWNSAGLYWDFGLYALAGDSLVTVAASVGSAALILILVGWGWRDGRWGWLLWLAAAEVAATVAGLAFVSVRLYESLPWAYAVISLPLAWEPALRIAVTWVFTVLLLRVVMRRMLGETTVPGGET